MAHRFRITLHKKADERIVEGTWRRIGSSTASAPPSAQTTFGMPAMRTLKPNAL
jgi:hypothetical protein